MKINVSENAQNGLCCSCGVCKAVCPRYAITYNREKGMYIPSVDKAKCNMCGLCAELCPGYTQDYSSSGKDVPLRDAAKGDFITCYNAWSKDADIRHVSASGGVVTTLVQLLLDHGLYEIALCVDTYQYADQVKTTAYDKESFNSQLIRDPKTPKSRYVPVSHEKTIEYLLNNRGKRVIIIAVPCAMHAISRVISKYRLNKESILLIGLFCQKSFQYNIYDLFCSFSRDSKQLTQLHFKNKESGGWPGNLKLFYSDGTDEYLSSSYRTTAKDYFQPERCLYCIDKLCVKADISLGDNYTGKYDSPLGSNSVIIRTEHGLQAWIASAENIDSKEISIEDICEAQAIEDRIKQYGYAELKKKQLEVEGMYVSQINTGTIKVAECELYNDKQYKDSIDKLRIGEQFTIGSNVYENALKKEDNKAKLNIIKNKIKKPLSVIKRKVIQHC